MSRFSSLVEILVRVFFGVLIGLLVVALLVVVLPVGIVAVVVVLMIRCRWRAIRQRVFLSMLAETVERRIPLIPALQAFGEEYGSWRGRVRRLASALREGIPLAEALRLFPDLVPVHSLPLIQMGQQSGRLADALRQAADRDSRDDPIWHSVAGKIFYLVMFAVFFCCVWLFMAVYVMPAYAKIFQDFNLSLPLVTQGALEISIWGADNWFLIAVVLVLVVWLLLFAGARYAGSIAWDLPGTGWITRRLDTAAILESLALVTDAAHPIPRAMATLTCDYPKGSIRRRLRRVWLHVAAGRDWCDGLVRQGLLGAADAGVLKSASRSGNLVWALRQVADSNRRRFAYRLLVGSHVLFPIVVCTIGFVVCWYVLACFVPLITLIDSLT